MANTDAWAAGWSAGKGKKDTKGAKPSAATDEKGHSAWSDAWNTKAKPGSYAKGGKVRKTGVAKVHKGEIVLTAAQAKMCAGKPSKKKGARKRITSK